MNLVHSGDGLVRPAAVADAAAIAGVHVATWQAAYAGLLPDGVLAGLDVSERTERWHTRLAAPPAGVFALVYERRGQVRGFVSAGPDREGRPGGEVFAIYVHPQCQGQGAGRRLLAAAGRIGLYRGEPLGARGQPSRARLLRIAGLAQRRQREAMDLPRRRRKPHRSPLPD